MQAKKKKQENPTKLEPEIVELPKPATTNAKSFMALKMKARQEKSKEEVPGTQMTQ